MIVSSLVASVAEPEPTGVESTAVVAQVVGDTGQAAVHTAEAAAHPEGLHQRRCRDLIHDEHRLS